MAEKWTVVAEPVGDNPGGRPVAKGARDRKTGTKDDKDAKKDNVGGIVFYVAKGHVKEEVARVGFVRKTTENPKDKFDDKVDEIVGVAKKTCDTLNDLDPDGDLV